MMKDYQLLEDTDAIAAEFTECDKSSTGQINFTDFCSYFNEKWYGLIQRSNGIEMVKNIYQFEFEWWNWDGKIEMCIVVIVIRDLYFEARIFKSGES